MYVVLTSKPGQYRTEPSADINIVESWNYMFYGRLLATFAIGQLRNETRVRVVEEDAEGTINWVPSKFLERFESLSDAKKELEQLTQFGSLDARLEATPEFFIKKV